MPRYAGKPSSLYKIIWDFIWDIDKSLVNWTKLKIHDTQHAIQVPTSRIDMLPNRKRNWRAIF